MARKPKAKTIKMRAWRALSAYVRARDKRCVTCGGSGDHCGHFIRNSERSGQLGGNKLWFDERNFGAQCARDNLFLSGAQDRFALYLEKKYGHGILQELFDLYNTPKKWSVEELLEVETKYKAKMDNLSTVGLDF